MDVAATALAKRRRSAPNDGQRCVASDILAVCRQADPWRWEALQRQVVPDDTLLADMMAPGIDRPFRVPAVLRMVRGAGLRLLSFWQRIIYEPETHLQSSPGLLLDLAAAALSDDRRLVCPGRALSAFILRVRVAPRR